MTRSLAAVVLAAVAASVATADIPPPPPPKGKKYVNVTHEVKVGKDVKGYVFVAQTTTGPGRPTTTSRKVELGEKAVTVVTGGRRNYGVLYAVPEAAAKEYKSDKELYDAVAGKKVKGVHELTFSGTDTLSDTVKGDGVTWTHTITGIDEKGIKTDVKGDGVEKAEPEKKGEKKEAFAAPGYLIGGAAAAVAVALGGLWLVRRKK